MRGPASFLREEEGIKCPFHMCFKVCVCVCICEETAILHKQKKGRAFILCIAELHKWNIWYSFMCPFALRLSSVRVAYFFSLLRVHKHSRDFCFSLLAQSWISDSGAISSAGCEFVPFFSLFCSLWLCVCELLETILSLALSACCAFDILI